MRLIPILTAVAVGLFATSAMAQSGNPGSAPGVSSAGGKAQPVDKNEVKRDNTSGPGVAPGAKMDGGKAQKVDPAEVKRDKTGGPGH